MNGLTPKPVPFIHLDPTRPVLEVQQLSCERGQRRLFSELSFRVPPGTLLRVAGRNGSGKTSLLRMISGLLEPSSGSVVWKGAPARRQREEYWKDLMYVGHLNGVKDDLTVAENLRIASAIAGRAVSPAKVSDALESIGLKGVASSMARLLSQGQRRRIALARLFVSDDVPLWLLDEPFAALDAVGVAVLAGALSAHLERGHSVVMTTHQEVELGGGTMQRIDLDQHVDDPTPC